MGSVEARIDLLSCIVNLSFWPVAVDTSCYVQRLEGPTTKNGNHYYLSF